MSCPCGYPIKLMVRAHPEVHAGPLDPSAVRERSAAQNRFIGITYVIRASSQAQVLAPFAALKLGPQVLLVL
ncbi:MAG: DUF493 family protein [Steroidobacterales bacterium]